MGPEEAQSPSFSLKRAALGESAPSSPHTQTDMMATKDKVYQARNPNKAKLFALLKPEDTWVTLVGSEEV